ncbi:Yip1 family protein [Phenylobacterium sp.]|uniref:Yip1 family protein n=1 Tax=Phenylobacterium sp. TaxID=1871053 RepID=UPI002F935E84
MSVVEPGPARGTLARVGGMMFRPGRTWDELAEEPAAARDLIQRYVAPLAAVPAVCGLIGMMLFGYSIAGIGFQANPLTAVIEAAADFSLTLGAVLLIAWAIHGLARPFGATPGYGQALKVAAYFPTAYWVSGVFSIYPSFGLLAGMLAALYSLYAMHLGLKRLMAPHPDHALSYFATVLGAVLVITALKAFLVGRAAELGGPLRTAAAVSGFA